jgi:hypothetical protein
LAAGVDFTGKDRWIKQEEHNLEEVSILEFCLEKSKWYSLVGAKGDI